MLKIAVFPNLQKKDAVYCTKAVCEILKDDSEIYIDKKFEKEFKDKTWIQFCDFKKIASDMDIVITIGGDGTILRCARYIKGCKAHMLGINTGTLGFMASVETNQLFRLKDLISGNYSIKERMMLEVSVKDESDNEVFSATALNDITIGRAYSKIFDFDIYADSYMIGSYRADGVIFSTPTGSTAYALSAGGPVIEPELECIEMNLICPHSLSARTVIFSVNRILKLKYDFTDNIYISVDGNEPFMLKDNQTVTIKTSEYRMKLIDMNENTFFDSLDKKIVNSAKK